MSEERRFQPFGDKGRSARFGPPQRSLNQALRRFIAPGRMGAQSTISSTCAGWLKAGCTLIRLSFFLCLCLHGKIARFAATLRFTVTLFRVRFPLATVAQRRNRRVKQDEVSARLARVKPDDRTT
jgi:hypothetical protein